VKFHGTRACKPMTRSDSTLTRASHDSTLTRKNLDDSDSTDLWLWIDKNDSGTSLPMYGIQKWGEVIVSRIFVFAKCC